MKIGETWKHKNKAAHIRVREYLGADEWKVSFMGVSLVYKGDFIYDNFYKVSK